MKIGKRVIKTGIAVSVGVLISSLLEVNPFYIVIASVIVMQPTVIDTWKFGANRMIGTAIGAVIGVILIILRPDSFIIAGLGMVILLAIMNKIKKGESISIGGVVYTSIYFSQGTTGMEHVMYASQRLFETLLGVLIAVIINYLIFPPNYDKAAIIETRRTSKFLWKYSIDLIDYILGIEGTNKDLNDMEMKLEEEIEKSEKIMSLQEKQEQIKIYGELRCRDTLLTIKLEKEIFQNLKNIHTALDRHIDKGLLELVKMDLLLIKDMMSNYKNVEENVLNEEILDDIEDLTPIIEQIKKAKKRVKLDKNINSYKTDEVIVLLVFLYNLEQALVKTNLMPDY